MNIKELVGNIIEYGNIQIINSYYYLQQIVAYPVLNQH